MRVLDDDRDPRVDDLPVDADTHNDVDLERAGQHRRRDLREPQLGQASGAAISASAPVRQVRVARALTLPWHRATSANR